MEKNENLSQTIELNNNIFLQNQILAEERIADLEYVLGQLRSQLLDTNKEDSLIIQIINNVLK